MVGCALHEAFQLEQLVKEVRKKLEVGSGLRAAYGSGGMAKCCALQTSAWVSCVEEVNEQKRLIYSLYYKFHIEIYTLL